MTLALGPFDPAAYLDTPEAVAEYLVAAFESGEQAVIADALGVVAKARGMTQKVLHARGVRLTPEAASNRLPGAAT